MSRAVSVRKGNSTELDAALGILGEIGYDETSKTLRVFDGQRSGGYRLLRADNDLYLGQEGNWNEPRHIVIKPFADPNVGFPVPQLRVGTTHHPGELGPSGLVQPDNGMIFSFNRRWDNPAAPMFSWVFEYFFKDNWEVNLDIEAPAGMVTMQSPFTAGRVFGMDGSYNGRSATLSISAPATAGGRVSLLARADDGDPNATIAQGVEIVQRAGATARDRVLSLHRNDMTTMLEIRGGVAPRWFMNFAGDNVAGTGLTNAGMIKLVGPVPDSEPLFSVEFLGLQTNILRSLYATGDQFPRFTLRGDGLMSWGAGGENAVSVILGFDQPGRIKVVNDLLAAGALIAGNEVKAGDGLNIWAKLIPTSDIIMHGALRVSNEFGHEFDIGASNGANTLIFAQKNGANRVRLGSFSGDKWVFGGAEGEHSLQVDRFAGANRWITIRGGKNNDPDATKQNAVIESSAGHVVIRPASSQTIVIDGLATSSAGLPTNGLYREADGTIKAVL
ncbi:MAG: hypothetical protein HY057_11255 [Rhodospirillales bacterium]|nr:hypothetical protein [Rhodospirillales bacterium]